MIFYIGGVAQPHVGHFGHDLPLLTLKTISDTLGEKLLVSLVCSCHGSARVAIILVQINNNSFGP